MMEYDNTNRGALFKNDKEGNDNRPDYKGQGNVNGVEVWISAWIKKSANGTTFMSLSFRRKDEDKHSRPTQAKPAAPQDDDAPPF
jgi:uncharacterized protein (DUF736 family)